MEINGISVVICCYNSARRIETTLLHLVHQEFDKKWEVILVDNNCRDNTVEVALSVWSGLKTKTPLNIVKEYKSGLSFARQKGISASKYDIIVFVDDDNHLHPDYLHRAYQRMQDFPNMAAIGGQGIPIFEEKTSVPDWFPKYASSYATGPIAPKSGILHEPYLNPYGAGLVLRKNAVKDVFSTGFTFALNDRKGLNLESGGDIELLYAVRLKRYDVFFDEDLIFNHFIPKNRLEYGYFKKINFYFGKSSEIIRMYDNYINFYKKEHKLTRSFLLLKHLICRVKEDSIAGMVNKQKLKGALWVFFFENHKLRIASKNIQKLVFSLHTKEREKILILEDDNVYVSKCTQDILKKEERFIMAILIDNSQHKSWKYKIPIINSNPPYYKRWYARILNKVGIHLLDGKRTSPVNVLKNILRNFSQVKFIHIIGLGCILKYESLILHGSENIQFFVECCENTDKSHSHTSDVDKLIKGNNLLMDKLLLLSAHLIFIARSKHMKNLLILIGIPSEKIKLII
ncbi:MAG: hypothetical protein OHK0053_23850 [Microscillaceae bacterium]